MGDHARDLQGSWGGPAIRRARENVERVVAPRSVAAQALGVGRGENPLGAADGAVVVGQAVDGAHLGDGGERLDHAGRADDLHGCC
jgi:hypothetical protein